MARFYSISVQPSLFGLSSVVRQWGRIGTIGRYRVDLYDIAQEAENALVMLFHQKCCRGYVAINC